MELSTGKILEENLIHSAFHKTLGAESTFRQDNGLKHNVMNTPVEKGVDSRAERGRCLFRLRRRQESWSQAGKQAGESKTRTEGNNWFSQTS